MPIMFCIFAALFLIYSLNLCSLWILMFLFVILKVVLEIGQLVLMFLFLIVFMFIVILSILMNFILLKIMGFLFFMYLLLLKLNLRFINLLSVFLIMKWIVELYERDHRVRQLICDADNYGLLQFNIGCLVDNLTLYEVSGKCVTIRLTNK